MEIHTPDHPITGWKVRQRIWRSLLSVSLSHSRSRVSCRGDHRLLRTRSDRQRDRGAPYKREGARRPVPRLGAGGGELEHADEVADLLIAHKPLDGITMALHSHDAELKNAAVTTGQITGAFGYMDTATSGASRMFTTCGAGTCACRSARSSTFPTCSRLSGASRGLAPRTPKPSSDGSHRLTSRLPAGLAPAARPPASETLRGVIVGRERQMKRRGFITAAGAAVGVVALN